jgi:hypothetical protein
LSIHKRVTIYDQNGRIPVTVSLSPPASVGVSLISSTFADLIKMKRFFLILILSATIVLTICCSKKSKSTNPTTKDPDFAIEVNPKTQWVMAGDSAEFQIKLTSLNDFSAPCTLSAIGFPRADSVIFDSKVLVPPDSLQLKINATFSTPRETYKLVITGKNGKLNHSDTVALMVPSEKVTDYYPLAIGNSWTWALLGQNGRIWDTYTLTIIDTDTINGNFGYLVSGLTFVYVKGDTIFYKSGAIILAGPLVIGQSWTFDVWNYELIGFGAVILTDGTEYEQCVKFQKTGSMYPGAVQYEWWAKGIGLVKMEEYISEQLQSSRELVSFTLH